MRRRLFVASTAAAVVTHWNRAAAGEIATYSGPFEVTVDTQSLTVGRAASLRLGSRVFVGIYNGIQVIGGVRQHVLINAREVDPSQLPTGAAGPGSRDAGIGSAQVPQASQAAGRDGNQSAGNPGGRPELSLGGLGAAAAWGAGAHAVYRLAFVSPALERQLTDASRKLSTAEAARTAAVEQYTLAVDQGGIAAAEALTEIRKDLENPTRGLSARTGGLADKSVAFGNLDLSSQIRAEECFYGALRAPTLSPVHGVARDFAVSSLSEMVDVAPSDHGAALGALAVSEVFVQFLRTSTDVILSLNPISSAVRNAYELTIGKDFIGGEALSASARTLRAVFLAADLATLGVAASVEATFRTLGRIVQKMPKVASVQAGKLYVVVEGMPFEKHAMDRYLERVIIGAPDATANTVVTIDRIRDAVTRSEPYFDRMNRTLAFHSALPNGEYLRVAVTIENPTVKTMIIRSPGEGAFNLEATFSGGKRFVPWRGKVPNILVE